MSVIPPPGDGAAAVTALDPPWHRCLELAWAAHLAGSVPVGAVVVGPDGTVVAEGRNRSVEPDPPPGQLGDTYLAHAEVNALASLPRGVDYSRHVLYTTLEPCLLCTAAMVHTHVGEVRYAATDHLWHGLARLPELNAHVARRWPARTGPLTEPCTAAVAAFAAVLPLLWTLERAAPGAVVDAYERHAPALLALARDLHRTRPAVLRQDSPEVALHALWPQLAAAAGRN